MNDTTTPFVSEELLHAFVDGQLDAADEARVEAFLAARPDERDRVEAFRSQNTALKSLFATTGSELDDDRLIADRDKLGSVLRGQRQLRLGGAVAASVLALAVAASGGWFVGKRTMPDTTSRQAAATVVQSDFGVGYQWAGASDSMLSGNGREVFGWLVDRVPGAPVTAPDLRPLGLHLKGGRVLTTLDGPAIQLAYGDDGDRRIALSIAQTRTERQIVSASLMSDEATMVWRRGPLVFGLFGSVSHGQLIDIARMVSGDTQGHTDLPQTVAMPEPTRDAADGVQVLTVTSTPDNENGGPAAEPIAEMAPATAATPDNEVIVPELPAEADLQKPESL